MTREELIELYLSLDDLVHSTSLIELVAQNYSCVDPVFEIVVLKEDILELLRAQEKHIL